MSADAARPMAEPDADFRPEKIGRGREIIGREIAALQRLVNQLDENFSQAVQAIVDCAGSVVVTGIGKAGLIGQKISASFSSTGTPSHFLHPAEAVHGDLGSLRPQDIVLYLSYSGQTEEVLRLLPTVRKTTAMTIAITSRPDNALAQGVDVPLIMGDHEEACALGLAPSTSTTCMLALGDALALVASETRQFTSAQFAEYHPGGSLGRQLSHVTDIMRPLEQCRVASSTRTVREVFVRVSCPGRRTGAIMLTDQRGRLVGIFTDSDLARLLERADDAQLDQPVSDVMTTQFRTVDVSARFAQAMQILSEFKISELPVVDDSGRPRGIVDITDVMGAVTGGHPPESPAHQAKVVGVKQTASSEPRILPLSRFTGRT